MDIEKFSNAKRYAITVGPDDFTVEFTELQLAATWSKYGTCYNIILAEENAKSMTCIKFTQYHAIFHLTQNITINNQAPVHSWSYNRYTSRAGLKRIVSRNIPLVQLSENLDVRQGMNIHPLIPNVYLIIASSQSWRKSSSLGMLPILHEPWKS